ncbi:MoaD/ThiS family protein [Tatumella citrea]|uniref:Molybdopterin synthase sulfur carrier subunit n=1 Tax=Tatumella citrea TaxID=53336 RepID=A0A1Y0LKA5_TATCI|nr:MoaD/ThiS family protein [Tatumella citrea]ARU94492.1 molybdopterin synthase sulfur carrier subunit [Tatumella citrea]ARU98531.1 molybdopterin synthase sulfur carrier subunit [Tatumella citrea]
MAATLFIPTALRVFTDGQGKISLQGNTVGELIAALAGRYPDISQHLYDDTGELRSFINLYVGETNIRSSGGLSTPVGDGAEVLLVPAIAGGSGVNS